jgi:hypothetical protein
LALAQASADNASQEPSEDGSGNKSTGKTIAVAHGLIPL